MNNMQEEPKTDKIEEAIEEAVKFFFSADKQIAGSTASRGGVIRAFRYAMHTNLTTKKIKLKSKEEEKLAFYFMLMLDNRTIMQAKRFEELSNEESSNEGEL